MQLVMKSVLRLCIPHAFGNLGVESGHKTRLDKFTDCSTEHTVIPYIKPKIVAPNANNVGKTFNASLELLRIVLRSS